MRSQLDDPGPAAYHHDCNLRGDGPTGPVSCTVEHEGESVLSEPKTNEALLKALRDAPSVPQSAEDIRRQRVSFVVGFLGAGSGVTRARIEQIIDRQDGRKAS